MFLPWTALLGYMLLACTKAGATLIHAFVLRDCGVAVVPMILCAILLGGWHSIVIGKETRVGHSVVLAAMKTLETTLDTPRQSAAIVQQAN